MPVEKAHILTKIIATVGPSCLDQGVLVRLIEEGTRVFRINFSHGSFEEFATALAAVRKAGSASGRIVGVLGDLSGPKIRVGKVVPQGIMLNAGDRVEFQRDPIVAGEVPTPNGSALFSTTYPAMISDVVPGERLLINDGEVRLLITEKTGDPANPSELRLVGTVTIGGLVTSSKGINLPDSQLTVPSITEKDWACVDWAVKNDIDFLALSFVRKADDIKTLKARLAELSSKPGNAIPVIAKIEKPQAIDDLTGIIDAADGLMVARGDLGVEMDLAMVPVIQKRIIAQAHDYGKPVIVATQMLQSMIESPNPTRAEVSDVANAIYDGADAVMLSGETAVGKYPVQAVHMMGRIALNTQNHLIDMTPEGTILDQGAASRSYLAPRKLQASRYRTAALAHGVSVVVQDLAAKLVVIWSELGGGARYLSQNRLPVPIIAASSRRSSLRRMSLLFGVLPVYMQRPRNSEEFIFLIDRFILENNLVNTGDAVVVVTGEPIGTPGVTNELHIHYVSEVPHVKWVVKDDEN